MDLKWKNKPKCAFANIYRGSRPESKEHLQHLWDCGVRTIVNLEEGWSSLNPFLYRNAEADWKAMGGTYFRFGRSNIFPAYRGELLSCDLLIERSAYKGKVYVHCFAGVDRTGEQIAFCQVMKGDDPLDAWDDAVNNGMHLQYRLFWKRSFMRECRE